MHLLTWKHLAGRLLPLACAAALLAACTEYPVRFERIDTDQLRVLDFSYTNLSDTTAGLCEAAPGDSMLLTASFSGVPLTDVQWEVAWDVLVSPYSDTAFGRVALPHVDAELRPSGLTDSTDVWAIRFRVPDSVLEVSSSVSEWLASALGGSKAQVLAMVDSFARLTPQQRAADTVLGPWFAQVGGLAAQALAAPVRVFARANGVCLIRSDFTVRYGRLLREYADVHVNRNPVPQFVGVYKVKGAPLELKASDLDEDDTTLCLYSPRGEVDVAAMGRNVLFGDTLLVDVGHSYYVAVDSGIFGGVDYRDSTVGLSLSTGGVSLRERGCEYYATAIFYEHAAEEVAGLRDEDLFVVGSRSYESSLGRTVEQVLPPLSARVTRIKLWVQVYDEYPGEWLRPDGSTLVETDLYFRYSQAYLDSLAGK